MDKAPNLEFETLLISIQKCLKFYTIKELNEALVSFFSKKQDSSAEVDFVLESIAADYNITKRTLIYSTARGSIQEAKEVAYCVLHLNLGITLRYISNSIFFKKNHNSVAKAIRKFKNLNPDIKPDREFKYRCESHQKNLAQYLIDKSEI